MCIGGISGNPSYVNNKVKWLQSKGWKTNVFDTFLYGNVPICYPELSIFAHNRVKELGYHLSWFSEKQRECVYKRISRIVDSDIFDEIVVESNSIILAEWGELLAKLMHAKHLSYIIGENVVIKDKETFDLLYFKYRRNELFSITEKSFENLFRNYLKIEDANNHFWSARSTCNAENVKTSVFKDLPERDWTITHFGRRKQYFPDVIHDIITFANKYSNKHILFLIVGNNYNKNLVLKSFISTKNVVVRFIDPVVPIPQLLFDLSDVVIATAGCARISFHAGAKTISMDVENNRPLGVLGYTTIDTAFGSQSNETRIGLFEHLSDVLIKKKYNGKPCMDIENEVEQHGYDYHISFAFKSDGIYFDGVMPYRAYGKKERLDEILVKKMRLIKLSIFLHSIKSIK